MPTKPPSRPDNPQALAVLRTRLETAVLPDARLQLHASIHRVRLVAGEILALLQEVLPDDQQLGEGYLAGGERRSLAALAQTVERQTASHESLSAADTGVLIQQLDHTAGFWNTLEPGLSGVHAQLLAKRDALHNLLRKIDAAYGHINRNGHKNNPNQDPVTADQPPGTRRAAAENRKKERERQKLGRDLQKVRGWEDQLRSEHEAANRSNGQPSALQSQAEDLRLQAEAFDPARVEIEDLQVRFADLYQSIVGQLQASEKAEDQSWQQRPRKAVQALDEFYRHVHRNAIDSVQRAHEGEITDMPEEQFAALLKDALGVMRADADDGHRQILDELRRSLFGDFHRKMGFLNTMLLELYAKLEKQKSQTDHALGKVDGHDHALMHMDEWRIPIPGGMINGAERLRRKARIQLEKKYSLYMQLDDIRTVRSREFIFHPIKSLMWLWKSLRKGESVFINDGVIALPR